MSNNSPVLDYPAPPSETVTGYYTQHRRGCSQLEYDPLLKRAPDSCTADFLCLNALQASVSEHDEIRQFFFYVSLCAKNGIWLKFASFANFEGIIWSPGMLY